MSLKKNSAPPLSVADEIIASTLATLPPPIRKTLKKIPVILEPSPSQMDIDSGIDPETLGYYQESEPGIARIRIWVDNIWAYSHGDRKIFRQEVRTTLLHEIGHAIGWDEADLEVRGLSLIPSTVTLMGTRAVT